MESTQNNGPLIKREPMAHKFETPQVDRESLRGLAEKVVTSNEKGFIDALAEYKQGIFAFMNKNNINLSQVEALQDDKRILKGGFKKRAVQEHPFLGAKGKRLVRDKLSNGVFLSADETGLYEELLLRKLIEETRQLYEANGVRNRGEKVGDALEVLDTILETKGISPSKVESKRKKIDVDKTRERRKLSKKKK